MHALYRNGRSFAQAVERAAPGSSISYHVGFLARDAHKNAAVADVASMARRLSNGTNIVMRHDGALEYGMGVGTLIQRRISTETYEYIFKKTDNSVRVQAFL